MTVSLLELSPGARSVLPGGSSERGGRSCAVAKQLENSKTRMNLGPILFILDAVCAGLLR
jgi:hypothetical protein